MKRVLKNLPGMTMIEIMLIVVIIGVLAGLSLPMFGRYARNNRVKSDARALISAARLARSIAVSDIKTTGVSIVLDSMKCVVFEDKNGNGVLDTADVWRSQSKLSDDVIFWNVTFPNNTLIFYRDGSSNGGRVKLGTEDRLVAFELSVLASTGRVKLRQIK
ncbi:GspH/FimT family pseudopilin [bacterium]|nr:GspH/FimT family pseudopilin [bacterium]